MNSKSTFFPGSQLPIWFFASTLPSRTHCPIIPSNNFYGVRFCIENPLIKGDNWWWREKKIQIFKSLRKKEALHHIVFDTSVYLGKTGKNVLKQWYHPNDCKHKTLSSRGSQWLLIADHEVTSSWYKLAIVHAKVSCNNLITSSETKHLVCPKPSTSFLSAQFPS